MGIFAGVRDTWARRGKYPPPMSSQNIRDMIFVNKPLDMGRIKQVGFGIDNTLVLYKPEFY